MFKEEFILKKTPYRKKQIIAISLLFISGISLIFLESGTVLTTHESIRKILVNAFEGGFVGGLCDWFAVWKTYNAIENDSLIVAEEIGQWVASDLLDKNTLKNQINDVLDSPETNEQIYKLLDSYFDTKENTKKILENFWAKIESSVVEYIVHNDEQTRSIQPSLYDGELWSQRIYSSDETACCHERKHDRYTR